MAAEFIPLNEKDMKIRKRIESDTDTYVVVDLETTGRNHYKDEITEIGAIRYEAGKTALETESETLVESETLEEWQVKLTSKFSELENELALWKGSFSIMENKSKGGKVSSYAICVYEPDLVEERKDSSRNTILARVREDVLKSNADIVEVYSKSFGQADEKKRFEKASDELIDCLVGCIRSGIQNYVPKADVFACCSRYQECSNAGKCIHPNGLYAKACQYRKNLEEGNVFY